MVYDWIKIRLEARHAARSSADGPPCTLVCTFLGAEQMLTLGGPPASRIHHEGYDEALRRAAARRGREHTFRPTPVSVFFGEPDVTVPDPYFGGKGPERTGCNFCGGCMVGCKPGAKNTLDKNYLYLVSGTTRAPARSAR